MSHFFTGNSRLVGTPEDAHSFRFVPLRSLARILSRIHPEVSGHRTWKGGDNLVCLLWGVSQNSHTEISDFQLTKKGAKTVLEKVKIHGLEDENSVFCGRVAKLMVISAFFFFIASACPCIRFACPSTVWDSFGIPWIRKLEFFFATFSMPEGQISTR